MQTALSETQACVQNKHTPLMSPYRIGLCLAAIGWSANQLARCLGAHRTTVRRWITGETGIERDVGDWLEALAAAHRALLRPIRLKACVQNGHKSPMSAYRLRLCLLTIGWSGHELARRSGCHRTTIRRWLDGSAPIGSEIAEWLEALQAVHLAMTRPVRRFLAA
jgi:transcriptional regulator with XRE-family HTH domain